MSPEETEAGRLRREREAGASEERIRQHIVDHCREIDDIRGALKVLATTVGELQGVMRETAAVTKAVNASVKEAAVKALTARKFYLGVGMLTIAIAGVLLGVHGTL